MVDNISDEAGTPTESTDAEERVKLADFFGWPIGEKKKEDAQWPHVRTAGFHQYWPTLIYYMMDVSSWWC